MIDPGGSETVTLGVISEDSQAWCTVPSHKEAGMLLDIKVTGAAPAAVASGDHATGDHPAGSSGESAGIDFAATHEADWQNDDTAIDRATGDPHHTHTPQNGTTHNN